MTILERVATVVQDWPVLLQGALGSALFWFALLVGQRAVALLSSWIGVQSKRRRESNLKTQLLRFEALKAGEEAVAAGYASVLLYRAARPVIKAMMWLTLGMIFDSILRVLGLVGFLGCLYYLLAAFNVVRPLIYEGDIDQKIAELEQKLADNEQPG